MKTQLPYEASQMVNKLGKYVYKHLDGAFKFRTSSNNCDVFLTVLYQIPYLQRIPGKGKEYNDVHEMTLDINFTTYQNKLRVNIIEVSETEKTIGHYTFKPDELTHMATACDIVLEAIIRAVCAEYEDYEFIF